MFDLSDTRLRTTPGAVDERVMDGVALPVCTISIRRHEEWSAVVLRGELDRQSAGELRAIVASELAESRSVLVELVGLEFCDVDGLRTVLELVRLGDVCRGQAAVEVHGARGQVAGMIRQLGMEDALMPPESGGGTQLAG